jgi:hypothetical protein
VPETLLAAATTTTAGRYALQVPAAQLKAAAVDSGYANLEIDSPAGILFFPYQTSQLPAHPSAPITVNLGGKPPWPCGYDSAGQPYELTRWRLLRHTKPAWAVVGQGYIVRQKHTAGDYVKFDYAQTRRHTQASALGVGLSGYGLDAGYSDSGTNTSTATRTQGFGTAYGNAWFRTLFKTGQFRGECYGPPFAHVPVVHQHSPCPRKYEDSYVHKCLWLTRSAGWFGGSTTVYPSKAPRTSAGNCAQEEKGGYFDSDFGTAIRWASGFELGAMLNIKGVNLKASFSSSAQTGYDANAHMYFRFSQKGYLCGTNASPSTAALLVTRGTR